MKFECNENSFCLSQNGVVLLDHSAAAPCLYVGIGEESVDMYRGNFKIEDYVVERVPLTLTDAVEEKGGYHLFFGDLLEAVLTLSDTVATVKFVSKIEKINRFWIRVAADKEEHIYGCGEQMSYFDLRGRHFPLWTSEPGVGRDKTTYVTWRSDVENKAGGDYYNTNYPQPTFVSTKKYWCNVKSTAYADFDFRHDDFHELQVWEVPEEIRFETADTYIALLKTLTDYFGRQPELPDWVYNGLVIGAQGGNERSFGILDKCLDAGVKVSGLWCQDWVGKRVTSFGKRLQWNWKYNREMYPDLPEKIKEINEKGVRFLGYVNPYLVKGSELFDEAAEKGYFARKSDGEYYLVDFGEFDCGVIDLTDPEAFEWFKGVIKEYSIGIGIDGWMADFGEYLPTDDIVLHSGKPAMIEHNHWPALWAKCNYEAVKEAGKLGEVVYFMRAGAAGSQKYCTLLWAGDQSVDFSIHDGLATVIVAALSSGMTGCGLNHSDIGGYTSLFGNVRTKEVFLRWAEMAAFTPFMRTHEGNRPDDCFQFYDDDDTLQRMARLTTIYTMLAPYTKQLVKENAETGTPVQRALFLHYEDDPKAYEVQTEYLYGRDLLVAPVYLGEQTTREVYLPKDHWVHLWTGEEFEGGTVTVDAPLGHTPVFYRKGCDMEDLFREVGQLK